MRKPSDSYSAHAGAVAQLTIAWRMPFLVEAL